MRTRPQTPLTRPATVAAAQPNLLALDGSADDWPATTGLVVAREADPDGAALDAEPAWVAERTGTVLTRERELGTGALLLRAERPLGGQERVDPLCAPERLAAVRYADPDAEETAEETAG